MHTELACSSSPPPIAVAYRLIGGSVLGLGGVDLDATLELRAVFDADARGGDVADHRAVALDVNAIAGVKVARYLSVDDNSTRVNLGRELRGAPNRERGCCRARR